MLRKIITCALFFAAVSLWGTPDFDQDHLARLNSMIADAASQHDVQEESEARIERICFFYNTDLNDSLYKYAPIDMEFNRQHKLWENYYLTWNHLANDYIFSGKVNTGLRELQKMHEDAMERDNHFGMGVAYYGMGNAYLNMERYDEAERAYGQSLHQLNYLDLVPSIVNDVFSYYCDVLNNKKKYEKMLDVVAKWQEALKTISVQEKEKKQKKEGTISSVWTDYFHIASAQAHMGLGHLEKAAQELDKVELEKGEEAGFIGMSLLYYRAQLYLQQGNYTKALELNSMRLRRSEDVSDVSSPVLIRRQRVEILKHLNMYKEATEVYEQMFNLRDSFNNRSMRDQINELNTLFRVDEIAMEHKLSRSRYMTTAAIAVGTLLALFMIYWYFTSRRLRNKNEELTIAHEQAQESSRMKTKFIQNMSHEVRTPLNILSGFSQIITQGGANLSEETRKEAGEKIIENTRRITHLIDQLLALSESDSRTIIERTEAVSCNTLCGMAISQSGVAEDRNHHFEFKTELSDGEIITTNATYASRALCQLLENAQKFSPNGGTIKLSCEWQDNRLLLTVENTVTTPIPEAEAEHIFEPFVQLDDFHQGVGVGLSVSRNVIRRLGGDIALDTSCNDNVRFVLALPR